MQGTLRNLKLSLTIVLFSTSIKPASLNSTEHCLTLF